MTVKTLESINRFDVEQGIMKCWQVVDDLDIFLSRYMDGKPMTEDEVANVLLGMKSLYELKFQQLFSDFEQCIKNGSLE